MADRYEAKHRSGRWIVWDHAEKRAVGRDWAASEQAAARASEMNRGK